MAQIFEAFSSLVKNGEGFAVTSFASNNTSIDVINVTTPPFVPPDPSTEPLTLTTPSNVGVTLGGVTYPAQVQTDGTYLIILPISTSLSAITLGLTLPTGAGATPGRGWEPWNCCWVVRRC